MQTLTRPANAPAAARAQQKTWEWAGLALVIGLAIVIRGTALGYDLPFIYHPDEPLYIDIIQSIYRGDLNPHFFNYPTLFFYINALVYVPVFWMAGLLGNPVAVMPVDTLVMGATLAQTPEAVLVSRWVSVGFGLGSLLMVYLLGRQLSGRARPGLLAALLLAIAPTAIRNNRFVTPDTFVVFFILAAVYFSVRVYRRGAVGDVLWAGICAGLAASSKYNAGLVVLVPLLAHLLRYGWKGILRVDILRILMACGLAFFLTSPFILLDWAEFWTDFSYEAEHYSAIGHPGMEGNSLIWYLNYLWIVEGAGVIVGALTLMAGFIIRLKSVSQQCLPDDGTAVPTTSAWKEWLLVFGFPVMYFAFISNFIVRNDRTLLPVIPFLLLAAAILLVGLLRRARRPGLAGRGWLAVGLAGMLLSLVWPVTNLVQFASIINRPAPADQARAWLDANLKVGTKLAIESYAPYVRPSRYVVVPVFRAILQDAGWYRDQGVEYLILASSMYGRYYCEPQRYPVEKGQYDRLFEAFEAAATFENPSAGGLLDPLIVRLGGKNLCLYRSVILDMHDIQIRRVSSQ